MGRGLAVSSYALSSLLFFAQHVGHPPPSASLTRDVHAAVAPSVPLALLPGPPRFGGFGLLPLTAHLSARGCACGRGWVGSLHPPLGSWAPREPAAQEDPFRPSAWSKRHPIVHENADRLGFVPPTTQLDPGCYCCSCHNLCGVSESAHAPGLRPCPISDTLLRGQAEDRVLTQQKESRSRQVPKATAGTGGSAEETKALPSPGHEPGVVSTRGLFLPSRVLR